MKNNTIYLATEVPGGISRDTLNTLQELQDIITTSINMVDKKCDVVHYGSIIDLIDKENSGIKVLGIHMNILSNFSEVENLIKYINCYCKTFDFDVYDYRYDKIDNYHRLTIKFASKKWKNMYNSAYINTIIELLQQNSEYKYFPDSEVKLYIKSLQFLSKENFLPTETNLNYNVLENINYFFNTDDSAKYSDLSAYLKYIDEEFKEKES